MEMSIKQGQLVNIITDITFNYVYGCSMNILCLATCPSGYFFDNIGCQLCNTTMPNCLTCSSSYVCLSCPANCRICTNASSCSECDLGYTQNGTGCSPFSCTSINPFCTSCANSQCLSCQSGKYLSAGSCLQGGSILCL